MHFDKKKTYHNDKHHKKMSQNLTFLLLFLMCVCLFGCDAGCESRFWGSVGRRMSVQWRHIGGMCVIWLDGGFGV